MAELTIDKIPSQLICLKYPFDESRIHVLNERANKCHLFSGVIEYDSRILRRTSKTIRSHHHGQITRIHFCDLDDFRLREHLKNEGKPINRN